MKRLILLRHAKSSWDDPTLADHERPLAPRGVRAAPAMARWLHDHDYVPDRILCSDAVRTQQTWALVARVWEDRNGSVPEVMVHPNLYLASARGIRTILAEELDSVDSLMVVGHNPGLHHLASTLAIPGGTPAHDRLARKFPTAAAVVLDFDVPGWGDLSPGEGRLVAFMRPKDLPRSRDLDL